MLLRLNLAPLGLPEFAPPPEPALPMGQVLVMEAVSLLTVGHRGAWADRDAVVRLVERLWNYGVAPAGTAAGKLVLSGLMREGRVSYREYAYERRQGKRDPEGQKYGLQVLALTPEGLITHFAERARLFKPPAVSR